MSATYLTTEQLSERIHYDTRTIRDRLKDSGAPASPLVRFLVLVFVEANLLLAAVVWYLLTKRKRPEEEDYLYTECRGCRKRLRYLASRVGQPGKCPRCKFGFVFPPLADDEEGARPWWKNWPWGRPSRGSA